MEIRLPAVKLSINKVPAKPRHSGAAMRRSDARILAMLSAMFLTATVARAGEPVPSGTRMNNLKVLSDKVDDVTTVENLLKSFIKPKMTDQERARAIWTAVVKYRHQAPPPDECLA